MAQACPTALQLLAPQRFKSPVCLLLAALQELQTCLRMQCLQAQHGTVRALHGLAHSVLLQGGKTSLQALQAIAQITAIGHQQFRCHRGRGCTQVCGEIGKTEVGFVANR